MTTGLPALRTVADYQFGAGAGPALFPPTESLSVSRSSGGRPRQVHADGGRIVSYGVDGRFTLGLEGGRRLLSALSSPAARVTVGDESEPFVRDGRNAFAKFVQGVDSAVRAGDEVAVVTTDGDLLGVVVARAGSPEPLVAADEMGGATAGGQLALTSGGLFAPPAFGYLADTLGYRTSWWLLAAICLIAAGLLLFVVRVAPPVSEPAMDD